MNFRQLDNEHFAQPWERMKTLVKNFPTHGLTTWMVIQTFYTGLDFTSQNLLDSATGGTFMSTTLGATTKLLDEMMLNYSQWHTERSPTGKKVNSVKEISSLNEKVWRKLSKNADQKDDLVIYPEFFRQADRICFWTACTNF